MNIKLVDLILNIRVYSFVKYIVCLFIAYALIDICWKVITHNQYDMEQLLVDIQQRYPDSRLTFQNIIVVDNHFKVSYGRGGQSVYKDSLYLYIRNGELHREPSFFFIFIVLLHAISAYTFEGRSIKLRNLYKIGSIFNLMFFAVVIFSLFFSDDDDDHYQYKPLMSSKSFSTGVEQMIKLMLLDDYRQ